MRHKRRRSSSSQVTQHSSQHSQIPSLSPLQRHHHFSLSLGSSNSNLSSSSSRSCPLHSRRTTPTSVAATTRQHSCLRSQRPTEEQQWVIHS